MNRIYSYVLSAVLVASLCACGNRRSGAESGGRQPAPAAETRSFEMVVPPAVMTDTEERMRFMTEHYWDKFDFSDSLYIGLEEVTEQAFADYVDLLQLAPRDMARVSVETMLGKAAVYKPMYLHMLELYDKYLYDPNSPMRNEELYLVVLEAVLADDKLDEYERVRPAYQLSMARRNRVGTRAADLGYTTADGSQGTLYGIRADFTLLFFNNPGCPMCKELREEIGDSPLLSEMINRGTMKVLAFYPDAELDEWRDYASEIPASWINGYDTRQAVNNEGVYDVRAIPSLYLLDRGKTVLLKDVVSVSALEDMIFDYKQ